MRLLVALLLVGVYVVLPVDFLPGPVDDAFVTLVGLLIGVIGEAVQQKKARSG